LEELKDSIRAVGLSNPIRVEQTDSGYELIQGFRRLAAFKELAAETGDARYGKIPAALVPRGDPLVDLYRKMVDENLVRKDISFGEMAQLALSYAHDEGITSGEAVSVLYASALKQKRSYIRQFARVLDALGEALRYPEAIPRSLGTELYKVIEAEEGRGAALMDELTALPNSHDAASEMRLLRDALTHSASGKTAPPKSVSKTSLRLARPEGEARVIAQDGKVELRLPKDFSAVSREKLQGAIEVFLSSLD
jgi:ParB family chromosome partitioning protein